jgi:AcrR family transcriptional regulator
MTRATAQGGRDTASRLVEVAARLLDEEGEAAVTARRVTAEAGVSTMAVYTHFGSMDDLLAAIWREGYARFGAELDRAARTADPVADWMTQGWGYRHFGRREPHLYKVMFGDGLASMRLGGADDEAAAIGTFFSLLTRLERCVEAGRFALDDLFLAGEAVWATVHGHTMIELTGYHERTARDPIASYGECLLRLAIGLGDAPTAAHESLARAARRARRAGQLD